MEKKLKVVEFRIDLEDEESKVCNISLVKNPAIEKNFEYFSKNNIKNLESFEEVNNNIQYFFDEEKYEIVSPVMIPDMRILRVNPKTGEKYECWFSKETVKQFMYRYMKQKNNDSFTIHHKNNINDLYLVEVWVVEEDYEVKKYGVNLGTWMSKTKVENKDIWQDVKNEVVKGFSVEIQNFLVVEEDFNKVEEVEVKVEDKDYNEFIKLMELVGKYVK